MGKINKRRIARISISALLFFLFIYFFVLIFPVITPFFIAFLLAYLLDPIVDFLEEKGINRTVAIFLIYFTLIISTTMGIIYGLPKIVGELNKFGEAIPIYTEQIEQYVNIFQKNYSKVDIPESIRIITDDS
ncbi:MAG: AI-2E family transporter, partial [Peptococcales bacterium]